MANAGSALTGVSARSRAVAISVAGEARNPALPSAHAPIHPRLEADRSRERQKLLLNAFGYASLRSDRIADWADYGPSFLGLQLADRTASTLTFRMDDRKQRIVVSSEETAHNVFGWELEDAAA